MQHKVYILTGAIQTGKTTALIKWCEGKENVYGILTPVINGKRVFLDIATNRLFAMEVGEDERAVLKVGRFVFSVAAFEKAKSIIINSLKSSYLIIDEVGPLELRKEGLFEPIDTVLKSYFASTIVFVVRDGLVDNMLNFFSIKNAIIITQDELQLIQ